MKKRINFVDVLFSNEGHYVCDIKKYSYLERKYELHYFINGELNDKNRLRLRSFTVHESPKKSSLLGQFRYLMSIRKLLSLDDFNFIMSTKYISLLVFSLLSNFYSYFLLVHFFPTTKILSNKAILWFLLNKSNGFMVLDRSVKENIERFIGKSKGIEVIRSRDLEIPNHHDSCNSNLVVSFIGAINSYKDISQLLELLNEKHYPGLEFHLYSKGITEYVCGMSDLNNVVIKDEYFSPVDYSNYLKESDYIFLSYKPSYGVRFSGMVFDALNYGCPIICNDNPSFKFLSKYNACRMFSNKADLDEILLTLEKAMVDEKIYVDFSKEEREIVFFNLLNRHFKINQEVF
ncbi:hypothetical protein MCT03_05370 [Vibrio aestuarianus]|nr:hypothetical protein [Vibrio aestuarianus]